MTPVILSVGRLRLRLASQGERGKAPRIPIDRPAIQASPVPALPEILADVGSLTRSTEPAVLSHFNIRRVVDIYGSVDGRDLGATGRDVARIIDSNRKSFPRGTFVSAKGQAASAQQLIQNHAETEDVGAVIDGDPLW